MSNDHDAPTPAELRGAPRTTYARSHAVELPAQSERDFQCQVLALAKLRGWLAHHVHDSRRSAPGLPDLILVRVAQWETPAGPTGRIIFAELKTEKGRVTREQRQWLDALAQCGKVESYVWRPSQFNEIDAILA